MVRLYKDGDRAGIVTDSKDENRFIQDVSEKFATMIEHGLFDGDWAFQFQLWFPQIVDICNKYRGYKNNVIERRELCAGSSWADEKFVVLDNVMYDKIEDSPFSKKGDTSEKKQ